MNEVEIRIDKFIDLIELEGKKEFVNIKKYTITKFKEDLLYGDYTLHLKYYNVSSTYEKHMLVSLVDDATLFVRPVINVYKSSLK